MIEARGYQKEAIAAFKGNDYSGIFEMATGTGKTITSLLCSRQYYEEYGKIFLVILVPFKHLVPQWIDNINLFYDTSTLRCNGAKKSWLYRLDSKVRDFNNRFSNIEIVISTYKAASSVEFNDLISKVRGHSFLIADECHYFGMKSLKEHKLEKIRCKLGLSATPDRWWDDKGSSFIRDYFKDTIYSYDMEMAIDKGNLTPYDYHYYPIELAEDEVEKYSKLTRKLVTLMSQKKKDYEEISKIALQRTRIVSRARNKKDALIGVLKKRLESEEIRNTLVYCAMGTIEEMTREISKLGIKVHRFDSTLSLDEREKVLERFANGDIEVLTAMKCLDEGVDVPSTQTAYFLASTSNPREFIQRRGRVLRTYKGKYKAVIYDFVTMSDPSDYAVFKSIVSKEMPRFAEFSRFASNKYRIREQMREILEAQELEHLLDKLPWEVYQEQMREMEEENGY